MKAHSGTLIIVAVLVGPRIAAAQADPPTISIIEAYRSIQACAEAEDDTQDCDDVTDTTARPLVDFVQAEASGNLGSSAEAKANQDSQVSSVSIRGNVSVSVWADLGGGEEAYVQTTADSTLSISFTIPVDSPFTLSGSFTATGFDNGVCLGFVGGGIAGINSDGFPFNYNRVFDCLSFPDEAAIFFTGIAKANTPLQLGFDAGASAEGGDGFDVARNQKSVFFPYELEDCGDVFSHCHD